MRSGCYDCVRKHIGQAIVLMCEVEKGYHTHGWLAVGHLAEAEDESLRLPPGGIVDSIRQLRLSYIDYLNGQAEFNDDPMRLLELVTQHKEAYEVNGPTSDSDVHRLQESDGTVSPSALGMVPEVS